MTTNEMRAVSSRKTTTLHSRGGRRVRQIARYVVESLEVRQYLSSITAPPSAAALTIDTDPNSSGFFWKHIPASFQIETIALERQYPDFAQALNTNLITLDNVSPQLLQAAGFPDVPTNLIRGGPLSTVIAPASALSSAAVGNPTEAAGTSSEPTAGTGFAAPALAPLVSGGLTVQAVTYNWQTLPNTLAFQFSQDVGASINAADFVVVNTDTGAQVPVTSNNFSYSSSDDTATLSFASNPPFSSANYTVTLLSQQITDAGGDQLQGGPAGNVPGQDYQYDFFYLMGDADHNSQCNNNDYLALEDHWQTSGPTINFSTGDFNYDGTVGNADYLLLRKNLNTTLVQLGAPGSVSFASTSPTTATVAWQPASDPNVTTYDVYRGVGNTFQRVATNVVGTSYADSGLVSGTSYSYFLVSRDAVGDSSYASPVGTTAAVVAAGDRHVNEGSPYLLNLAASARPQTFQYWTINWGDGTAPQQVSPAVTAVPHTFTDDVAAPTVNATAVYADQSFAAPSITVNINEVVTAKGAPAAYEGSPYTLDLGTADSDGDAISNWVVNWGDGSAPQTVPGTSTTATHTYTSGPQHPTIVASATEAEGTYLASPLPVTVVAVPPKLTLSGDPVTTAGATYTLGISAVEVGSETISGWTINWGDGTSPQSVAAGLPSVTHTFAAAGSFAVSATASDVNGAHPADPIRVAVLNVATAPAYLLASGVGAGLVDLSWSRSADPNATFSIQQSSDGTNFTTLTTTAAGVAAYTVGGLNPQSNYWFRLLVNSSVSGDTGYSNTATATTLAAQTLYSNNFEGALGGEWSAPTAAVTPGGGGRTFLGEFGNGGTTLSLAGLPAHAQLTVSFDVYVIRGWGGVAALPWGPTRFQASLDGSKLADTTFSNQATALPGTGDNLQDYPDPFGTTKPWPAFTGASEQDTLGYQAYRYDSGQQVAMDAVYHFSKTVADSSGTLTLNLAALGLPPIQEASWGVDNVTVAIPPAVGTATDLTATATVDDAINLRWVNDAANAGSTIVQRSTDGTNYQALGSPLQPGVTLYQDGSVQQGQTYYYRVYSTSAAGQGGYSNVATATAAPLGGGYVLQDTVGVPVNGGVAQSHVSLQSGAYYELQASGDFFLGGPLGRADAEYAYSATTGASSLTSAWPGAINYGIGLNDTSVDQNKAPYWGPYDGQGHTYDVDVLGTGSALTFGYHDDYYPDNVADDAQHPLQVEVLAHVPASPGSLQAVNGSPGVNLTWQDNSIDETGFEVDRSTDGVNFSKLATVGANVTSFADTTAATGQTYYYEVYAYNNAGKWDPSNVASNKTSDGYTVTGHVWQTSVDGSQRIGGLAGWRVYADDDTSNDHQFIAGEPYAITQADGSFTLANLNPNGAFSLRLDMTGHPPADLISPSTGSYATSGNTGVVLAGNDYNVYLDTDPYFASKAPPAAHVNPYGSGTIGLPAANWTSGDVFASLSPGLNNGALSTIAVYTPGGRLLSTLPVPPGGGNLYAPTTPVIDMTGHLIVPDTGRVAVEAYSPDGSTEADLIPNAPGLAEGAALDDFGNIYLGSQTFDPGSGRIIGGSGIYEYSPQGELNRIIPTGVDRGRVDSLAVAPDQHTIYYTDENGDTTHDTEADLYKLDANAQNTAQVFASIKGLTPNGLDPTLDAFYILPNGGFKLSNGQTIFILAAGGDEIYAFDPSGNLVTAVNYHYGDTRATWITIAPAQDGTSFWVGNSAAESSQDALVRFDIATGKVMQVTSTGASNYGLAVYGGPVTGAPIANSPYSYLPTVVNPNGHTLQFSLSAPSYGATIDASSGLMTWTPPSAGTYTFTINAADAEFPQLHTAQTFTVTVDDNAGSNTAPVFLTAQGALLSMGYEGIPYSNQILASDPDGDALSYSLVNALGVSIDKDTGAFTFIPTAADVSAGSRSITVQVSDGRGAPVTRTFTIPVQAPATAVPVFDQSKVPPDAVVGQTFTFTTGILNETWPYVWSLISAPVGMTINQQNNATVTWTPTAGQIGTQQFTIRFAPQGGPSVDHTFYVNVTNPAIPVDVQELSATTYRLSVGSASVTALTDSTYRWSVSYPAGTPAPSTQLLDPNGNADLITFHQAGSYTVSVSGSGIAGTTQTTVAVSPAPTRVLISPGALSVGPGQASNLLATTYDQFGDPIPASQTTLAWTLATNGSGGSINSTTGAYTAGTEAGTDVVSVTATLTQSAQSIQGRANIAVSGSGAMAGATAVGLTALAGQPTAFGDPTGSSGGPAGVMGWFYDPASPQPNGQYMVTVNWGDGSSSSGTAITVSPSTDPNVPASEQGHLFTVGATHAYATEGTKAFSIVIGNPGSPTLTINSPPGQGIVVEPAPVTGESLAVTAMVSRLFSGPVAEFNDQNALSNPANFSAMIDWGDGTPLTRGTIVALDGQNYDVQGEHQYASLGAGSVSATAYVYDTLVSPAALRATIPLKVRLVPPTFNAPGGVSATYLSNVNQVEVQWNPVPSDPTVSWIVQRTDPDGTVVTLPTNGNLISAPQGGGSPVFFDPDPGSSGNPAPPLVPGGTYRYEVIAVDQYNNQSSPSAPAIVRIPGAPAQPTQLGYSISGNQVTLTWTDGRTTDADLAGWQIWRAKSSGQAAPSDATFTLLTPAGQVVPEPTYTDWAADPHTQYWYEVVAVRQQGDQSIRSAPLTVTTGSFSDSVAAPTNLTTGYAGSDGSTYRVGLHWTDPAGASLLGYDVYRVTQAQYQQAGDMVVFGATTLIGSSNDTGYTDDLTTAGAYYYAVKAVAATTDGSEVSSPASNVAMANTSSAVVAPNAPSAANVADFGADHVTLTWVDNSVNEAGFEVRRAPSGSSNYQYVGRATQDQTTYTDTSVQPGNAYVYEIAAYNLASPTQTNYSTWAAATGTATIPASGSQPAAPTNLAVNTDPTLTTFQQLALAWQAPVNTPAVVTGYYVYRQQTDGSWLRLTDQPVTTTSYVDAALLAGTNYSYEVTSVSATNFQSVPATLTASTAAAPNKVPLVQLISPGPFTGISVNLTAGTQTDGRIRTLTPVRAIVDGLGGGGPLSWTLSMVPLDVTTATSSASQPIMLASGSTNVGSTADPAGQTIFTLDPTRYPSGNYQLTLQASNAAGTADPVSEVISLYSQTKLGNLNLPVTDLTFNVLGGPALAVRRVYDSLNANVLGDFGYGWQLDTSKVSISSTAQPGSDSSGSGPAFRAGDVLYITLPDGQQHAFQFWPVPMNYSVQDGVGADPYQAGLYQDYYVQFVCVDGSNATLTVAGDLHDPDPASRVDLQYNPSNVEFDALGLGDSSGTDQAYNPGNIAFGGNYRITTADGTVYTIQASAGRLTSVQDPNGNVTTYSANGNVSADGYTLVISRNDDGTISDVTLYNPEGSPISDKSRSYSYNSDGTLASIQDNNHYTNYSYMTIGALGHFLTQVQQTSLNPVSQQTILQASYDSEGNLTSLTDANGMTAPFATPSSDGSQGSQLVTNPTPSSGGTAGTTENVYDSEGNVSRQIQAIVDANGDLSGYRVTVTAYTYFGGGIDDELFDIFDPNSGDKLPGFSSQNSVASITTYAPFFIAGADAGGLRYSASPPTLVSQTIYQQSDGSTQADGSDPALRLPIQQIDYTYGATLQARVSTYQNYSHGKPGTVTVALYNANADGSLGTLIQTISQTISTYDSAGNLTESTVEDRNGSTLQQTYYQYTDGTDLEPGYALLPKGLPIRTYRVRTGGNPTNPNDWVTLASTSYYTATDDTMGAILGMVASTTDAAGRTTYYRYADDGQVSISYYFANGQWVLSRTSFDGFGRATSTDREFYGGPATALAFMQGSGILDVDPTTNPAIAAADGYPTVQLSQTNYDRGNGHITYTTDPFSLSTSNVYDADGNVIETTSAPTAAGNLVVKSVYDELGRVTWQTDQYVDGGYADQNHQVMATHTIYDSLGDVVKTERYEGTAIDITLAGSGELGTSTLAQAGSLVSSTATYYDDQGRMIEMVDAGGLRTGTIYYADGRIEYTGPLVAAAPDGGHVSTNGAGITTDAFTVADLASYTQCLYDQLDTSSGKPYSGLLYDEVIDPDGHATKTFSDAMGRTIATVYPDGSFNQTLYGVGDAPVAGHVVAKQTITGYQVTSIDRMGQATDSFYDDAGRLTDVYQPAVSDAYAATVLDDAPAGYWRLGETSGTTAYDASGHGDNGTYAGGVTLNTVGALTGDANAAVTFDGSSGYADLGNPASLNFTGDITIAAWIKISGSTSGYQGIVEHGYTTSPSDAEVFLRVDNGNYDVGEWNGGVSMTTAAIPSADVGHWAFLVGEYDGTSWKLYDNGTLLQSTAGSTGAIQVSGDWAIGATSMAGDRRFFNGSIDEVSIFNTALSLAQIQALYGAGEGTVALAGNTARPHWMYTYDTLGDKLSQTDPNLNVTTYTYDGQGDQLSHTLPGGQTESWTYDVHGRVVTHTDFAGHMTLDVYDDGHDGRLADEYRYATSFAVPANFHPDSPPAGYPQWAEKTAYVYDDASGDVYAETGGSKSSSLPSPEVLGLGRVVEVQDWAAGSSTPTHWTHTVYDPVTGQAASVSSDAGQVNYIYDPATGREIEVWTGTSQATATTDTKYGYDAQGRLASVTVVRQDGNPPAAPVVAYAPYDARGDALQSAGLPTTLYTYDAAGNLLKVLYPNGTETDYTWDPVNDRQTTTNKVSATGAVLSSYAYQLDADGRKTSDTETRLNNDGSTFSTTTIQWTYDALSRLTGETYSDGTGSTDDYTDSYTYDLDGNRISKTHTAMNNAAQDQQVFSSYNGNNELVAESSDNPFTPTALQYATLYTYDPNGSMLTATRIGAGAESDTYTYDLRNRLSSATVAGVTSTYAYDTDGNRVSQTVGTGPATTYLVDPQNPSGYAQVLEEHQGSNNTSYVIGLSGVIAQNVNGTVSYLLQDGHGSTRLLTNGTGGITGEYDYDAFGGQLSLSSAAKPWSNASTSVYLYSGERWDAAAGQYVMGAREYLPGDGRFSQQDSYLAGPGDLNNANLYVYCGGNPINGKDPSGHDLVSLLTTMGVGGILSAITTGAYGYAKGWSAGEIAKASGYAFLAGAAAGGLAFGAAAGFAAAAVGAGATAAEASAAGWTAVGLIGGPTGVGLSIANVQDAYAHGDSTDRAFAVVNLGLASLGFIGAHWSAFNMAAGATAAQLPQVRQNYIAGTAAENDFAANAQANGFTVVAQHVRVKTPFGAYRDIDVVLQDPNTGLNFGVEVKSSVGAFNSNDAEARQQFAADRWINENGAVGIGNNAGLKIAGTSKILWRPQ